MCKNTNFLLLLYGNGGPKVLPAPNFTFNTDLVIMPFDSLWFENVP